MATPTDTELIAQVQRLGKELKRRIDDHNKVEPFLTGLAPAPMAVSQARLTKLYGYLMPMATAGWGKVIIDSVLDRVEVIGIRDGDNKEAADAAWGVWQDNAMDSESKLGHQASFLDGRAFALVWDDVAGKPEITLDDSTQMIVEYEEGSRRKRTAALRQWVDEDKVPYATLYRSDGIFKFIGNKDDDPTAATWQRRVVPDEDWPAENPHEVVPVVELAVNRRLKPGRYGFAQGDYAHCVGVIDRIHLLTFLGLVVAVWMGFPLRGVIGEKIRRRVLVDDEGHALIDEATGKEKTEAIAPVDMHPDSLAQFENPDAKVFTWDAADRKNLSIFGELSQLAMLTKTPRHYFPQETGLSNISADTIRADEGGLSAKVTGHKASLGEGWEEVLRLGGMMLDKPVELSRRAAIEWADHESRSLAERADAASKFKDILPWQVVAEKCLNATPEDIQRWATLRASEPLNQLFQAAQQPSGVSG